jgi:predicted DNA-binding ribbon-helix-helix protein
VSLLRKRSLTIAGHRTSISLEEPFWTALRRIAQERGVPIAALVAEVDTGRGNANLSSALRLRVLEEYERRLGVERG